LAVCSGVIEACHPDARLAHSFRKEFNMATKKARSLQPGERIRVLVVDDSVVIRSLVRHALEEDPELEVVGVAANGSIALQRIPQLNPDVLTLDIEMPEMNGLETLRRVRQDYPQLRVIMFSTLTERGAAVTLEALTLGADDYVTKGSNEGSLDLSMAHLREEIIPKIKQFFRRPEQNPAITPTKATELPSALRPSKSYPLFTNTRPKVLGIGVSTGGPTALAAVLPQLPPGFPLPVLIVQHMPALFTRLLAERLCSSCHLPVEEASDGQSVAPGKILIAPGGFHLQVELSGAEVRVHLNQSPPQNFCRPAVDALFSSIAEVYGGAVIAMILTGMGHDGLRGSEILKAHGAAILAQDEASSVVWGMPGAVVSSGIADRVLPLDQLVPEILRRLN
jgi:two-component system, chemotaxis family, protein-glutamate methylesterase/glutaminase